MTLKNQIIFGAYFLQSIKILDAMYGTYLSNNREKKGISDARKSN